MNYILIKPSPRAELICQSKKNFKKTGGVCQGKKLPTPFATKVLTKKRAGMPFAGIGRATVQTSHLMSTQKSFRPPSLFLGLTRHGFVYWPRWCRKGVKNALFCPRTAFHFPCQFHNPLVFNGSQKSRCPYPSCKTECPINGFRVLALFDHLAP